MRDGYKLRTLRVPSHAFFSMGYVRAARGLLDRGRAVAGRGDAPGRTMIHWVLATSAPERTVAKKKPQASYIVPETGLGREYYREDFAMTLIQHGSAR